MKEQTSYHDIITKVIEIYDKNPHKANEILSEKIFTDLNKSPFQAVCQFIFLTHLRNNFLINTVISKLVAKKPKNKLLYALKGAIAEILISDVKKFPKIIHSWVNFAKKAFSKNEANFLNAVLRKIPTTIEDIKKSEDLSVVYSFPNWLIKRWIKFFGSEKTLEILKISNTPSEVFFRKSYAENADKIFKEFEEFFKPSQFENFYILKSGSWQNVKDILKTKYFYIQDPSTSFAVKKLEPKVNGAYLDLCASPGGKSRFIADLIELDAIKNNKTDELKNSILVSVDLPKRIEKLKENLQKIDFINYKVLECDLIEENLTQKLKSENLPELFDGVFIDAPCSNTGVLRRRPDARYRIKETDIYACKDIQAEFIKKYSKYVKIGGRFVFSTCSIDFEENEKNAETFLKENPNFSIEESKTYLPSLENDGCGVFVFKRHS